MLFTGVKTHSFSQLEGVVALPYAEVGRRAFLKNVILDRGVQIPPGLIVGEDPKEDAKRFRRTENGICLITQEMIDKLGK
jgi:glucose-1-phosphate adenylyltransferase